MPNSRLAFKIFFGSRFRENQITRFTEKLPRVGKNCTLSQCPGRAPVQEISVSHLPTAMIGPGGKR
jgi:hypothetical protein